MSCIETVVLCIRYWHTKISKRKYYTIYGCLAQVLLGPILNTLSHIIFITFNIWAAKDKGSFASASAEELRYTCILTPFHR